MPVPEKIWDSYWNNSKNPSETWKVLPQEQKKENIRIFLDPLKNDNWDSPNIDDFFYYMKKNIL